jgi:hypothetical protein
MDALEIPLVPFGKYKGKPVTTMMADQNYMNWAKNNHIFKEDTPIYNYVFNVVNITSNLDTPTPEHNEMQNLFLQKPTRDNLLNILYKTNTKRDKAREILRNAEIPIPESLQSEQLDETFIFETKNNWDMLIVFNGIWMNMTLNHWKTYFEKYGDKNDIDEIDRYIKEKHSGYEHRYKQDIAICNNNNRKRLKLKLKGWYEEPNESELDEQWKQEREHCYINFERMIHNFQFVDVVDNCGGWRRDVDCICRRTIVLCEIKPSVGDDYPCILRKINSQYNKTKTATKTTCCLIIKEFRAKGATFEQVCEIFRQHGICIVMLRDLLDNQEKHEETLEERVERLELENKALKEQLALKITS